MGCTSSKHAAKAPRGGAESANAAGAGRAKADVNGSAANKDVTPAAQEEVGDRQVEVKAARKVVAEGNEKAVPKELPDVASEDRANTSGPDTHSKTGEGIGGASDAAAQPEPTLSEPQPEANISGASDQAAPAEGPGVAASPETIAEKAITDGKVSAESVAAGGGSGSKSGDALKAIGDSADGADDATGEGSTGASDSATGDGSESGADAERTADGEPQHGNPALERLSDSATGDGSENGADAERTADGEPQHGNPALERLSHAGEFLGEKITETSHILAETYAVQEDKFSQWMIPSPEKVRAKQRKSLPARYIIPPLQWPASPAPAQPESVGSHTPGKQGSHLRLGEKSESSPAPTPKSSSSSASARRRQPEATGFAAWLIPPKEKVRQNQRRKSAQPPKTYQTEGEADADHALGVKAQGDKAAAPAPPLTSVIVEDVKTIVDAFRSFDAAARKKAEEDRAKRERQSNVAETVEDTKAVAVGSDTEGLELRERGLTESREPTFRAVSP